jgi:hypothetical protein
MLSVRGNGRTAVPAKTLKFIQSGCSGRPKYSKKPGIFRANVDLTAQAQVGLAWRIPPPVQQSCILTRSMSDHEVPSLWFKQLSHLAIQNLRCSPAPAVPIPCALPQLPGEAICGSGPGVESSPGRQGSPPV